MSTKRQQQFALEPLSPSSRWLLSSLIETLWCFVVSDSGQSAAVGFFFFSCGKFCHFSTKEARSLRSTSSESSAFCDWPTYVHCQLKAVFQRDSFSAEAFSFELVADLHLVTSK